ncbi:MAG: hypothetical protein J7L56_03160 [Halomonas sp.]|nr:hypothetical protein [Halomonas sp.]MCD6437249.1 hypothetical protein [Halomonas sp.]
MILEYHNENYNRRYPFIESAKLPGIPQQALLNARLIYDGVSKYPLFVPKIEFTPDSCIWHWAILKNNEIQEITTHSYTKEDGEIIRITKNLEQYYTGILSCVYYSFYYMNLPYQVYEFDVEDTQLEPFVVFGIPFQLSTLTLVNNGVPKTYRGSVQFYNGMNMRFRDEDGKVFLDAGDGLGLNEACKENRKPIYRINGVGPDENGDFKITGEECLVIEPDVNGIKLIDYCTKPCLGCEEIDELTRRVMKMEDYALELQNSLVQLQVQLQKIDAVINTYCQCPM